jgi:hypothetical protein
MKHDVAPENRTAQKHICDNNLIWIFVEAYESVCVDVAVMNAVKIARNVFMAENSFCWHFTALYNLWQHADTFYLIPSETRKLQ